MSLATSLLAGVAFGLAMAAPPGPMNAVIAEESVLRGWTAGLRAGLGALTGDAIFCALAFLGVVEVVGEAPRLRAGMILAGGLLMGYFAVDAARGAIAARSDDGRAQTLPDGESESATPAESGVGDGESLRVANTGFRKALALSLTNPYQIVFWLTVGVALLRPGELDVLAEAPWLADVATALGLSPSLVIETGSVALLAGFFGGIGVWVTGYPAALVAVGERTDRAAPAVAALSAVLLAGFGVLFVADGLATLL